MNDYAKLKSANLSANCEPEFAACRVPLPAEPINELVTQQILAVLSAPHSVQAVWERIQQTHPELTEPDVLIPMHNLARVWNELFIEEQCRLAQLLIERVIIADSGLEIFWRDQGWPALVNELRPGTLGAELQAVENAQ